jgi:DNA gyrase subunit B
MPDSEIMTTLDYRNKTLVQRFREMAFLTRGLTIRFVDNRAVDGKRTER